MPKSRKRKKKVKKKVSRKKVSEKKVYKPYEVVKHDFVQIENPFPNELSFEERTRLFVEVGNRAKATYEQEYKKLLCYFEEYDPLYLCSISAYYFARQEEGIDREAIDGHLEFPPFFLEILQCLSLIKQRNNSAKPLGEKIEDFKDTLTELNQAQSLTYYKLIEGVETHDDIGAVILRSEMMINTLAVRNWAYQHQMESIAYELAEFVEPLFSKVTGFESKEMLDVLFTIVPITEKKLNAHLRKTVKLVKARNYEKVYDIYETLFPDVETITSGEREEAWNGLGKNLDMLKATLLAHSDYYLSNIFTYEADEIHEYLKRKIGKEKIQNILNRLSLTFGSLSSINKDHVFLNNPVHLKPFIQLNDKGYFSSVPHILNHISVDLLESFLVEDTDLRKRYTKKKGKYLEKKVENLFRKSFPNAEVFAGSLWQENGKGKLYENDLILLIEDFAIIVECKSGAISPSARRGAPQRLFKTIKELVVEPSEQAIRFQNYLQQNPRLHRFKNNSGSYNEIDSSKIEYFVPLGITLSNLGAIGCNLKKLISAKIISAKLEDLAPSISFSDLETIFELLTSEAEKIHYLSRRREFGAHINFQGDELDLLGFYLDNGFNIGGSEYDENFVINLTLKSKELDPYFIGTYRKVNVAKPELKKTKYWKDLLRKFEVKTQNWLANSFILLSLPIEDQKKFETELKNLKKRVLNRECERKHNYMVMHFGPERRKFILAGYPYLESDREERNNMMKNIAAYIEDQENIRGYLILGYDMNMDIYPYSVLAGSLKNNLFDRLD